MTVNNYAAGTIFTNGASSTAIFAQSVGGGGGNGGYSLAVSAAIGASVSVSVGGNGGNGGDGGEVQVTNDGAITINGKNSLAIMAQSVGGGGGTASDALGVSIVPVFIGGQNGAKGVGGDVTVTNTGSIVINGNNSIGIFAQSVGGGGGMVAPGGGATSVTTQSGGTGDGGVVTIDNTAGSIIINGDNSIAIYSQSVGGGGGAVGLNADPPGQVGAFMFSGAAGGSGVAAATVLNQTGSLIATGLNSIAYVAQSAGGRGQWRHHRQHPEPHELDQPDPRRARPGSGRLHPEWREQHSQQRRRHFGRADDQHECLCDHRRILKRRHADDHAGRRRSADHRLGHRRLRRAGQRRQ